MKHLIILWVLSRIVCNGSSYAANQGLWFLFNMIKVPDFFISPFPLSCCFWMKANWPLKPDFYIFWRSYQFSKEHLFFLVCLKKRVVIYKNSPWNNFVSLHCDTISFGLFVYLIDLFLIIICTINLQHWWTFSCMTSLMNDTLLQIHSKCFYRGVGARLK